MIFLQWEINTLPHGLPSSSQTVPGDFLFPASGGRGYEVAPAFLETSLVGNAHPRGLCDPFPLSTMAAIGPLTATSH
jgi:hypothetical protein